MTESKTAAQAVPEILGKYANSLLAGDPDQWIQNWEEDCIQMPPGGPMNIGKQMLYESISAWLEEYQVTDLKPEEFQIQETGDWAFSYGNYSYRLTPADGSPPYVYHGKALTIYRRQPDGSWKIKLDCFNSNTPDH